MIEDLKRCLKCGKYSLRSNFHKDENRKDGLQPLCISCRKRYYNENREKTKKILLRKL